MELSHQQYSEVLFANDPIIKQDPQTGLFVGFESCYPEDAIEVRVYGQGEQPTLSTERLVSVRVEVSEEDRHWGLNNLNKVLKVLLAGAEAVTQPSNALRSATQPAVNCAPFPL